MGELCLRHEEIWSVLYVTCYITCYGLSTQTVTYGSLEKESEEVGTFSETEKWPSFQDLDHVTLNLQSGVTLFLYCTSSREWVQADHEQRSVVSTPKACLKCHLLGTFHGQWPSCAILKGCFGWNGNHDARTAVLFHQGNCWRELCRKNEWDLGTALWVPCPVLDCQHRMHFALPNAWGFAVEQTYMTNDEAVTFRDES